MVSGDTYGVTVSVRLSEELVALADRVEGLTCVKPAGMAVRFPLLLAPQTRTVIYPWRYARDRSVARHEARFRTPLSEVRDGLLSLSTSGRRTPDLLDLAADPQLFDAEWDAVAEAEAMATFGSVVYLAYASNATAGVVDQGFAEIDLRDARTGAVDVRQWQAIPIADSVVERARVPRPSVASEAVPARFDARGDISDDFALSVRGKGGEDAAGSRPQQRGGS